MAITEASETLEDEKRPLREKLIAVYIAVLAVVLSIAAMAGGDTSKTAAQANLDASNTWAFFQAKNQRRITYRVAVDQIEAQLAAEPAPSPSQQALLQRQLADYRDRVARYASEPETGEGMKELILRARGYEKTRDDAMARDPYFDYAQAFLQIAIVLATVAIIAGGTLPLLLSLVAAVIGVASLANGYALVYDAQPLIAGVANWLSAQVAMLKALAE